MALRHVASTLTLEQATTIAIRAIAAGRPARADAPRAGWRAHPGRRRARLWRGRDQRPHPLGHAAAGQIPVAPLVTGAVGLDAVAGAFAELASPERHAKIMVKP
jgi:hypothetical protein